MLNNIGMLPKPVATAGCGPKTSGKTLDDCVSEISKKIKTSQKSKVFQIGKQPSIAHGLDNNSEEAHNNKPIDKILEDNHVCITPNLLKSLTQDTNKNKVEPSLDVAENDINNIKELIEKHLSEFSRGDETLEYLECVFSLVDAQNPFHIKDSPNNDTLIDFIKDK